MLVRCLFVKNGEWSSYAIMGGFALIKQNQVTILANEAQSSESINPADAESAFKLQRKFRKAEGKRCK
jgi:F0F1-type ATP synthase epsilon subunit